jgi:GrpB-like predicted nucleotidyltransferase (UPF0157 family)
MEEALRNKIERLINEPILLAEYNPAWPDLFEEEATFLKKLFYPEIILLVEHFGSTAVPGCTAKPVIDMLVEVKSLGLVKKEAVPALEKNGYEHLWRGIFGAEPPHYAWFIKRDSAGNRTHHIHMVEGDSELWDRLYFRDWLRTHPAEAEKYSRLKRSLLSHYHNNREKYTKAKTDYIMAITRKAKAYYTKST